MSTLEQDFVLRLLADGKRLSGRKMDQVRPVTIEFGKSYGYTEIKLGKTRLAVQVSASVTKPREERPFEGLFHITSDVSSMASPRFENARQSVDEAVVNRVIEKAIRRSNALDVESLCIVAGKSCWMIRADVHYLDFDGDLVDATCIGVMAALLHFRRPDTSIDGDRVIIHDIDERPPVPLSIMHIPVCLSWSFFKDDVMVVDADAIEQDLRIGSMVITINKDRELCQLSKSGGELTAEQLLQCGEDAHKYSVKITDLIQEKLKEDYAVRNRGNMGFIIAENDR